jgi:F-type H+-transporting ATPase subunit gamma
MRVWPGCGRRGADSLGTLADLESRLQHLHELQDLVRALRGIAASRMQESQKALLAVRRYNETIGEAIGLALALLPEPPAPEPPEAGEVRLRLAIGTEHGFVGALNERLVDALRTTPSGWTLAVAGRRTAALALDQGLHLVWTEPMATHAGGIGAVARRLAQALQGAAAVELVHLRHLGAGRDELVRLPVVPLDLQHFAAAACRVPPLHHLPPALLLAELAGEHLLAELTRALTEALAAENQARLRVMDAADRNIGEKRDQLGQEVHRLRQEAITTELLDVITGAEAVARNP